MQKKIAFLFPGQGAQRVGMGKDFYDQFPAARQTLEEANDKLGRDLKKIIFEGPDALLTETANSQVALYAVSIAIMRCLLQLNPDLQPSFTAGLSLGEYTALTAAGYLPFDEGLALVQLRGKAMNEACLQKPGTMAVVMGLDADAVVQAVRDTGLHEELWAANFNCPGQIVISGTHRGVEAGAKLLLERGAKRVLPLNVHGAFHSGLMQSAAYPLQEAIAMTQWKESKVPVVLNTTAQLTTDLAEIKRQLALQVISPVKWEQSIRTLEESGVESYYEIGCGKALSGFNKRIGTSAPVYGIEKVGEIDEFFAKRS